MRWRFGGGCCWRSRRPSASRTRCINGDLLTFVLIGGGPTGVELAGALGEIARQALRDGVRRGRSGDRAHHPDRSGPVDPADVSRKTCASRRASALLASRRRRARGQGRHQGRRRRGVDRRRAHRGAHHPVGRRRRRRAAVARSRSWSRSRRPRHRRARPVSAGSSGRVRRRRSRVVLASDRQAAARRGAGRQAAGRATLPRTSRG